MVLALDDHMVKEQKVELLPAPELVDQVPEFHVRATKSLLELRNQNAHAILPQRRPVKLLSHETEYAQYNSYSPVPLQVFRPLLDCVLGLQLIGYEILVLIL